jgi:hypothetical protein
MKQIQLSRKIVISNETDAQTYYVANWYAEYFKEYNYQLEFLGVAVDNNVPNPSKILESLENTYAARFGAKLLQVSPFVDLNAQPLISREIRLTAERFKREMKNPELTIYLITEKLELLESFGSTLIFKDPSDESSGSVLTILLNETVTVYRYENVE